MPVEDENVFSIDSLQNSINEIGSDTVSQHEILPTLVHTREELQDGVQRKTEELDKARAEKIALEEQVQIQQYRNKELKKEIQENGVVSEKTKEQIEELVCSKKQEKKKQLKILKDYEQRMAKLGDDFRSGPTLYDRKHLTKELQSVRLKKEEIVKEEGRVMKEVQNMKAKFKDDGCEELVDDDAFSLKELEKLSSFMQKKSLEIESSLVRNKKEMEDLQFLASALENEIAELETIEGSD